MSKIIQFNPNNQKRITIIIPLETIGIEKIDSIKLLITKNILNQTLEKKLIDIIFLTYNTEEQMSFLLTNEYKEIFNSVQIISSKGNPLEQLNELVKNNIKTDFYCFRTIADGNINGFDLPFRIEWLSHHLEKSMEIMIRDKTLCLLPVAEFCDVNTYNIKEIPDLIDIRNLEQTLKTIQSISLEEIMFSKKLPSFSFTECAVKDKNGQLQFIPGILPTRWLNEKIAPISISDFAQVRIYIKTDTIRKPLRVIVDNNIIKAV